MALSRAKRRSKIAHATRVAVAAAVLASLLVGPAAADRPIAMTSADIEQLLATIKAEHPNASILKIEREHSEGGSKADIYEVKLLRPDGQVLKIYYDATSLAPVQNHADDDDDDEHHRRRERRRGHW